MYVPALTAAFVTVPLLVAPGHYRAKDPVWQYGDSFGSAAKPYCFAGIRTQPSVVVLFSGIIFNDGMIGRRDNSAYFGAVIDGLLSAVT